MSGKTLSPTSAVTTEEVRQYWENNPLHSLEIKEGYGEESFFKELERIKDEDVEIYTLPFWGFDRWAGKKVLDIGCGPGWYTVEYARGKAEVIGVDVTDRAVELTTRYLDIEGLQNGKAERADAQNLHFPDNSFDLVSSSGVLHHVPDPMAAFREVQRVLKPGGEARITLYYKNWLLRSGLLFRTMLWILKTLNVRHHNVRSGVDPQTPEEFVRMFDGKGNPLGIAKRDAEWRQMFREAGFQVLGSEVHFFPLRFVGKNWFFQAFRKFFDSNFGFLIYYKLKSP